jgi:hypothetical protein
MYNIFVIVVQLKNFGFERYSCLFPCSIMTVFRRNAGCDAALIGSALMAHANPQQALKRLVGG